MSKHWITREIMSINSREDPNADKLKSLIAWSGKEYSYCSICGKAEPSYSFPTHECSERTLKILDNKDENGHRCKEEMLSLGDRLELGFYLISDDDIIIPGEK